MNPASRSHITVAHDLPLLNAGIAEVLRATGKYRVTVADAGSGLPWPQADLIVTAGRRAGEGAQAAPLLVVDRQPQDGRLHALLQNGVKGYLLQTCTADELCRAVDAILGGSYVCPLLLTHWVQSPSPMRLTQRETEVLQVLAQGYGNKGIARRLAIEEETVKSHMKRLMLKLGAATRTQALAFAAEQGLVNMQTGVRA